VCLQYFGDYGWFTGEVTSYDGEHYHVVYEDGDSEDYDDREMEDIISTPDLADVEAGSWLAVYRPDDDQCYESTVRSRGGDVVAECRSSRDEPEVEGFNRRYNRRVSSDAAQRLTESAQRIEGVAEASSGDPPKYSVGTKVKKVRMRN
jgi:hypothetical protein